MNEIVSQNLSVTAEFMTHEQAKNIIDLSRLPADASKTLRIVCIGDYDARARIGLHVSNTSEVGTLKVISHGCDEERQTLRLRSKLIDKRQVIELISILYKTNISRLRFVTKQAKLALLK